MPLNIILELQQINRIPCPKQELIVDYSTFAFMDQKYGTLLQKNIKSSSLKGFKDNLKMNFQINTNLAVYASMLKYIIIVHFYFLHFLYMIYLLLSTC